MNRDGGFAAWKMAAAGKRRDRSARVIILEWLLYLEQTHPPRGRTVGEREKQTCRIVCGVMRKATLDRVCAAPLFWQ